MFRWISRIIWPRWECPMVGGKFDGETATIFKRTGRMKIGKKVSIVLCPGGLSCPPTRIIIDGERYYRCVSGWYQHHFSPIVLRSWG